jgi:3-deoxy-D-manno-octulosonic-acid transferase
MGYSLGLTLYNLAARPAADPDAGRGLRPAGLLVWLHASAGEGLAGVVELGRQLIEEDGVAVVLTLSSAREVDEARAMGSQAILQIVPPDFPNFAQGFLDHWRPDLGIFSGGELRPTLIYESTQRALPLLWVDARAPHLTADRDGWFPGLIKAALAPFRAILAVDDNAARALRKAGVEDERLHILGRMEEASAALPHIESDRAALAQILATRPVWLAADVAPEEEAAVIAAHRDVLRLAHRLLLILVPQDPARSEALAARLEAEEGWHVANRGRDEEPENETEVYIMDRDADYGLCYRLAPVTFLGGSLQGEGCGRNPMEAAAMGSAILYGPRAGNYAAAYARLGAARAARMVGSGSDLGLALGDLLAPDRAARQAQAAWMITSEGADVTATVLQMARAILDGTD